MFCPDCSRRRSPSTSRSSTRSRILRTSSSVRSFTYVSGSTPAWLSTSFEVERPMPYTYVSPISTLLFRGMLIPEIRAIRWSPPCSRARRGAQGELTKDAGVKPYD